jgi:hypothetical protein
MQGTRTEWGPNAAVDPRRPVMAPQRNPVQGGPCPPLDISWIHGGSLR